MPLTSDIGLSFKLHFAQIPQADLWLGVNCTGEKGCKNTLNITEQLQKLTPSQWHNISVPLTCLSENMVNLANIESPFSLTGTGSFAVSLADISIAKIKETDILLTCAKS